MRKSIGDAMKLSKPQERAFEKITRVGKRFGKDRCFIQHEVPGATYQTMMALVNKNYLIRKYCDGMDYFQIKK